MGDSPTGYPAALAGLGKNQKQPRTSATGEVSLRGSPCCRHSGFVIVNGEAAESRAKLKRKGGLLGRNHTFIQGEKEGKKGLHFHAKSCITNVDKVGTTVHNFFPHQEKAS